MTTSSADQGLVLPSSGDSSDAVTAFTSYNDGVESRLVKRYASAAERTVRNPTPNEGELGHVSATSRFYVYDGSAWVDLLEQSAPESVVGTDGTDASSLSSTTYATGATVCSATFTASSSGRAFVHLYGRLGSDGTNRTYLSFAINEDDIGGVEVLGASDNRALTVQINSPFIGLGMTKLVTGLTVGQTYFAYVVYRVSGGSSGAYVHREIAVGPAT